MLTDGDDIERRDGPVEAFERELADRLDFDVVLDFRVQPPIDQDLPPCRLVRESRREVVTAPIAA